MIDKKFWNNKNILITGVNGFVGGNLAEKLSSYNANVFGLIRNLNPKSYLFFEKINKKISIIYGNITDKELIKSILAEQRIEFIFHLAAQVEVGVAEDYPYLTWETNIRGTYSILEASRENKSFIKSIIIASSDKAYGEYPKELLPYKEDYSLKPVYPYDTSKACSDMIAQSYASNLFNLPIIITRFSNIYGQGQLNFSALIPDCIRSALGYSKFIPRGNGSNIRDFLYINDVVELYIMLSKELSINSNKYIGEIFNAGSKKPKLVKDVVKLIFNLIGKNKDYKIIKHLFDKNKTKGEISQQFMNYDKVFNYFNWEPTIELEEGVKKTIKWYKKYLKE